MPAYTDEALAEALLLTEALLLEALAEALAAGLAEALADELADAFADELAEALAEALAEVLALALCGADWAAGGPALMRRFMGVPDPTELPAAGIVPMTVPGLSWLVSVLINATSSPASVRI